jgi:hypothetical protein
MSCTFSGHFRGTSEEIQRTNLEFLTVLWHLKRTENASDIYLLLRSMILYNCKELSVINNLDSYFTFFCEEITSTVKLNRFLRNENIPFQQLLDFSGEKVSLEELPTLIRANPTKWLRIYADLINIKDLRDAPEAFEFVPGQDLPDGPQIKIWFNVLGTAVFMDPPIPIVSLITEMDPPEYFLEEEWSENEKEYDDYRIYRMIYLFHEHWKKIKKMPLRVVDIPPSEVIITNYAIGPRVIPKKVEVSPYLFCVAALEYECDCNILEWMVSGYF